MDDQGAGVPPGSRGARSGPDGPPERETIRLFGVADRGMAMGHLRGKIAFVPWSAPGDLVEVRVVREKRRHVIADLVRVLEPSPLRRPAPCLHFGTCGGCQWQHLPYPEQWTARTASFRGFVKSRLGVGDPAFRPAIPSPREFGYRNRVGLKVRQVGRRVLVGYFAKGSHRLVDVSTCPVAHPAIQELLPALRSFLQGFEPAQGQLPQIDLQNDGEERLWAVVHVLQPLASLHRERLGRFLSENAVAGCLLQAGRKSTLERLSAEEPKMAFSLEAGGRNLPHRVNPGGFVQANWEVNQSLVDEVAAAAPLYRGEQALDLYCGAGNFTLPLALEARDVVGIEGYPPGAEDARENALDNHLNSVRILSQPVAAGLAQLASEGFRPAFAVIDPPREGAADALDPLAALGPRHLLYISCSPPTLVRDLGVLARHGYRVAWIRAADMFPQTAHIESLTLLRRAGPRGT